MKDTPARIGVLQQGDTQDLRRRFAVMAPPIPDWFQVRCAPEEWGGAKNTEDRIAFWPWYYADLVMSAE